MGETLCLSASLFEQVEPAEEEDGKEEEEVAEGLMH
jgi:hypothetical protein